jgi:hypothetical protein
MPNESSRAPTLSAQDIDFFVANGFVRIDDAFPRDLAAEVRGILWHAMSLRPDDPAGWTSPVVRLGHFTHEPFRAAAGTARLHGAFDQLVGPGRWRPPGALGTFPVRFPSVVDPGDTGWHIDASFGTENPDFMEWRANASSRGRALLMLFLFSDVGPDDAPTRIRCGSQRLIGERLRAAGEDGLTLRELAAQAFDESAGLPEALATGEAGTVYLCHPFLVHAAQRHRGRAPRFLAQPPLLPRDRDAITYEGPGLLPLARAVSGNAEPPPR